ncbi:hypothetical protein E4U53_002263 [Claviceps sorghi]|nr:hypothetical protein E4U53_002263 [Claviceps sorghi]
MKAEQYSGRTSEEVEMEQTQARPRSSPPSFRQDFKQADADLSETHNKKVTKVVEGSMVTAATSDNCGAQVQFTNGRCKRPLHLDT